MLQALPLLEIWSQEAPHEHASPSSDVVPVDKGVVALAQGHVGVRAVLAGHRWVGEAEWSGEGGRDEFLAALAFRDRDFGDGGSVAGVSVQEHAKGYFGTGIGNGR